VDDCDWRAQIQLGSGDFLVSYLLETYGAIPEYTGHLQMISLAGQKLWGEGIRFCPDNDSSHGGGQMVPDGQGGAILVWMDSRGTMPTWELYGQHLSSTGEFLWDANGVLLVTPSNDYDYFQFDICEDGEGGAYITWPEEEEYSSHGDIYAQRIDGDSNPIWSQPVPVCTAANSDQHGPKITLSEGGGIIVWRDYRFGTFQSAAGQRLDPSGNTLWQPDGVNFDITCENYHTIMSDGRGYSGPSSWPFLPATNLPSISP
jgi:hypothetical protein